MRHMTIFALSGGTTLSHKGHDFRPRVIEHKMGLMYIGPCIIVIVEE
jgi:hypothetical protein